jgi:hypothetical protein
MSIFFHPRREKPVRSLAPIVEPAAPRRQVGQRPTVEVEIGVCDALE